MFSITFHTERGSLVDIADLIFQSDREGALFDESIDFDSFMCQHRRCHLALTALRAVNATGRTASPFTYMNIYKNKTQHLNTQKMFNVYATIYMKRENNQHTHIYIYIYI